MATSAIAAEMVPSATRSPTRLTIALFALAGCTAAAGSFALALTSDMVSGDLGEPLVIALLANWITIAYVVGGLLAWRRRPESRFGPLMIAAGFVNFLATLSWAGSDLPFTVGQALDLLPPVLFLHVFLAYPSGRLRGRFDRALVGAAYVTAIGLQLVRMALGDFGPHNLLAVASYPDAALLAVRVQLLAVSAFCLFGVGVLVARRRRSGRPLRRSLALLVDAFAVGLVMIAVLFLSHVFDGPAARLVELRGSRARIVDAGQKERQRLERNLHDGAQQRLIALSLELSLLEERLEGDPDAKTRLDRARREIATSLEELRAVARGIHPAVVSGHGLAVALEQLTARAPVPVRLNVDLEGRLPERLEVAAFYLVSESLANIGKHADAASARVDVARRDGQVVVEVADDGVGGADTERGSGLRGLADRVEALEGRLRVWSPTGGGTRVRAEIPCAR
jgi:signal transduction histidine kinase